MLGHEKRTGPPWGDQQARSGGENPMKHFGVMVVRKHWLMWLVFFLAVFITGISAVRTFHQAAYWRAHKDEPIHGWMTIGYIAQSYHVPSAVLYEALALPPQSLDKRPISRIARAQNRSVDEVIDVLRKAIDNARLPDLPLTPSGGRAP